MLTRIVCWLRRHPLLDVSFVGVDPAVSSASVAVSGRRCRCGAVVHVDKIAGGQFPRRRA